MAPAYMDEEMRHINNHAKEQVKVNNQNIYEGISINGKHYEFQAMFFFAGRLRIHIPTSFRDMPEELAALKYPFCNRPQIIKTDDTGRVNISLTLVPNNVHDQEIPFIKEGIRTMLKRLNPTYIFYEEGVKTVREKTIAYFTFQSPALDIPVYNLMFTLTVDYDVLLGNICCAYVEHQAWQSAAKEMLHSIRVHRQVPDTGDPQSGGQLSVC